MNAYTSKDVVCQMVIGMKEGGKARCRKIGIAGDGSLLFYRESSGKVLLIKIQRPEGSKRVRHVTVWRRVLLAEKN